MRSSVAPSIPGIRMSETTTSNGCSSHAWLRGRERRWWEAERHFRRAIALDPSQRRVREWFVNFLLMTGRREQALAEAERALALDPRAPTAIAEHARALAANGR